MMNVRDSGVSVRELGDRGYYNGSNVTYNVRHLVDMGYLDQERSERDRRSVRIRSTGKGRELCLLLADMERRYAEALGGLVPDTDAARAMLRGLERVWSDAIHFG